MIESQLTRISRNRSTKRVDEAVCNQFLDLMIMADITCPDCAAEMDQIERTTFTGRDMREYQCPKCGHKEIVDCGKALWQILSDANKESDEE